MMIYSIMLTYAQLLCHSIKKMRTNSHSHERAAINSRRTTLNGRGHVFRLDREFILVQSVVLPARCSHIRRKRPYIALEPHRSLCPNRENLFPLYSGRAGAARYSTPDTIHSGFMKIQRQAETLLLR